MSNIQKINRALAVLVLAGVVASPAHAHFILTAPDSWVDQDMSAIGGGAPQKAGPCGPGGYDDVQPVPSNDKVTPYTVGDTIHVTWQTTIPHDGYFRISLAENRDDFKDPHFDDATACTYDMSTVQTGAHDNVLMDGIKADAVGQDVVVPNMPCEKCTLQVIQVMKDHGPPNCIYYHCADIKIMPAGGGSGDAGVSDGGTIAMGTGGSTSPAGTGGATATGSGGTSAPTGSAGMTGAAGTTMKPTTSGSGGAAPATTGSGGSTLPMVDTGMPAPTKKDDSGCSVAQPGAEGTGHAFCFVLGLSAAALSLHRRRRSF